MTCLAGERYKHACDRGIRDAETARCETCIARPRPSVESHESASDARGSRSQTQAAARGAVAGSRAAETIQAQKSAQGSSHRERGWTADEDAPVLPRRSRVVLADADTREYHPAAMRLGLVDIVEGDLAVIAHQVVGKQRYRRDDAVTAESEIARLRNVDVNFHYLAQPGFSPTP